MVLNVLVVDDSSVMRVMIIRALRLSGLPIGKVHEAANGAEGLRVLDRNRIDLALVDINMPVMSGEEMIDRVRQNPDMSDLPIVVISTEGSETRIEKLRKQGTRFVHKPFTPEALREIVIGITGVSDELETELYRATALTFEELGFMLPTPELQEHQRNTRPIAAVSVKFRGPFCGRLVLMICRNVLPALAANMLAEEEAPSERRQQDALGEIANIICGNLLPKIAGPKAVFQVSAPQMIEGVGSPVGNTESPVAELHAGLEQGQVDLLLFIEDAAL